MYAEYINCALNNCWNQVITSRKRQPMKSPHSKV
jgi:hypothetical protein